MDRLLSPNIDCLLRFFRNNEKSSIYWNSRHFLQKVKLIYLYTQCFIVSKMCQIHRKISILYIHKRYQFQQYIVRGCWKQTVTSSRAESNCNSQLYSEATAAVASWQKELLDIRREIEKEERRAAGVAALNSPLVLCALISPPALFCLRSGPFHLRFSSTHFGCMEGKGREGKRSRASVANRRLESAINR